MNNRVYELRTKKGWSLTQLSRKSGLGRSTINNFENGKNGATAETMRRLADALGVSIDELFTEKKPTSIKVNKSDYPVMTKEQYIEELQKVLSGIETYKVRFFYVFTMAKLGLEDTYKR